MNDFKDLASFAGFSVLTGLSFGTTFFSLAFLYSSIEAQQAMNTNALVCTVLGVVGLFVGITQLNKKRQLTESESIS
ncbi:hypothetical protein ACUT8K_001355 [Vibrio parahaemolyticus]|jgi:hypothetical protein|uniref:Uncharacterized protein n=1 Tax=Vibrio diabolicus TaxID=50719 RepID=A0AA92LZZ0_9VIBR|nr:MULTISPECIES: hypothetical protein [Vibrio]KIT38989.1 membrane protein [Vibrio parahaemolyticus 3644]KIT58637.1 membrane protein [Vibrio parahaemolyticus EN9701072]GAJ75207.1 hypothetical protein JCM18905_965 [Vibrio sp. JCM 18905]EGQ8241733.1 hypothetical protein [Vibrio parahaemolyticus]EGQ8384396.1 hypothetical protein [Vibrio parahaemolyticus]